MLKYISRKSVTLAVAACLTASASPAVMAQSVLNPNEDGNVVTSGPATASYSDGTQSSATGSTSGPPALINAQEGPAFVVVAPRNLQNPAVAAGITNGSQYHQATVTVNPNSSCSTLDGINPLDC